MKFCRKKATNIQHPQKTFSNTQTLVILKHPSKETTIPTLYSRIYVNYKLSTRTII